MPYVQTGGMTTTSVISEIDNSGALGIDTVSSVTFGELTDATISLERDLTPEELEVFSIGGGLDPQRDYVEINASWPTPTSQVQAFDTQHNATELSARVQDIVSLNSSLLFLRQLHKLNRLRFLVMQSAMSTTLRMLHYWILTSSSVMSLLTLLIHLSLLLKVN